MALSTKSNVTALCGGVGGAKLAVGLANCLERPRFVINTGDDFRHYGLLICPDLDTVLYTLSGLVHPGQGWGRAEESFETQAALAELREDIWFQLGDKDLALHLVRAKLSSQSWTLTEVMNDLRKRLGIGAELLPMSDEPAPTTLQTDAGNLAFQDYFVRRRCAPVVREIAYGGSNQSPATTALQALVDPTLDGIIICPSNPMLSIEPILQIKPLRRALENRTKPALAVSCLVGGMAVKGPTAKLFAELGLETSAVGVARFYQGLIDALVIDDSDAHLADAIGNLGIKAIVAPTIMQGLADKIELAKVCINALGELHH